MNILNKQIDSIYDRQKNLYSKYLHYSQQNAESKRYANKKKSQQHLERMYWVSQKEIKKILILCISLILQWSAGQLQEDMLRSMVKRWN